MDKIDFLVELTEVEQYLLECLQNIQKKKEELKTEKKQNGMFV